MIGGIVGGILSALLCCGAGILLCRKISKQREERQSHPEAIYNQDKSKKVAEEKSSNPTMVYNSLNWEEKCSVCLDENCNAYLSCGHVFHNECISAWLKKNGQCPLCRQSANKKVYKLERR